MENQIETVKEQVYKLLESDNSGHGIEHIKRVLDLSLKIAEAENANLEIVALVALLHDADDYKLFGLDNEDKLTNTTRILNATSIAENIKMEVMETVKTIGYSKLLKGSRPTTLEGQIVSDADMCDVIGANGILRVHAYTLKNERAFFDRNVWPIADMTADKYTRKVADSSVCHIFEKILKLKNLMFTETGKKIAIKRHNMVVQFLQNLFEEENALDWLEYFEKYLQDNDLSPTNPN